MAYNGVSNSPYSVVTSVVTQAASGDQPNIAQFDVPAGATAEAHLATSTLGKTYALQFATDLLAVPVAWKDADSESGTGGDILLTDTNAVDAKRYYRIVEQ